MTVSYLNPNYSGLICPTLGIRRFFMNKAENRHLFGLPVVLYKKMSWDDWGGTFRNPRLKLRKETDHETLLDRFSCSQAGKDLGDVAGKSCMPLTAEISGFYVRIVL